jgi:hypothetical protein
VCIPNSAYSRPHTVYSRLIVPSSTNCLHYHSLSNPLSSPPIIASDRPPPPLPPLIAQLSHPLPQNESGPIAHYLRSSLPLINISAPPIAFISTPTPAVFQTTTNKTSSSTFSCLLFHFCHFLPFFGNMLVPMLLVGEFGAEILLKLTKPNSKRAN